MTMPMTPYEDEELRREVRECRDREHALIDAIRNAVEMPPPWILMFLSRAAKWPDDHNIGRALQRQFGLERIPPKSECEGGAGVWQRIREGLTKKEARNMQNPADLLEVCQTILTYQDNGDPVKDVIDQSAYSTDELIHELALFYVAEMTNRK